MSEQEWYDDSGNLRDANSNLRNNNAVKMAISNELFYHYHVNYDLHETILAIYQKINKLTKGQRRVEQLFYCTYRAHYEMGRSVDPYILADIFKVSHSKITSIISKHDMLLDYAPIQETPQNFIIYYINNFFPSLTEETEIILNILSQVSDQIHYDNPQNVAISTILFYISFKSIPIDIPSLPPSLFRSKQNLKTIQNRISAAYLNPTSS